MSDEKKIKKTRECVRCKHVIKCKGCLEPKTCVNYEPREEKQK